MRASFYRPTVALLLSAFFSACVGQRVIDLEEKGREDASFDQRLASSKDQGSPRDLPPDSGARMVDRPRLDMRSLEEDQAPAADGGLPPCTPALEISPAEVYLLPFGFTLFQGEGGSGAYRFELNADEERESGARLNSESGAYLAGQELGRVEDVRLTDESCAGESVARVQIVSPIQVRPTSAEINRGGRFTFEVAEGSSRFRFNWLENRSGGSLNERGEYEAGATLGVDRMEVEDLGTGERRTLSVEVVERIELSVGPQQLSLPVGSSVTLSLSGGSGVFELVPDAALEGALEVDGSQISAQRAATGQLRVVDRFIGIEARLRLQLLAPLNYPLERQGRNQLAGRFFSPGDLDGDGWPELLLGHSEVDGAESESGAVYLYRSEEGGLQQAPAQRFTTNERTARLGRALLTGDFNGDGRPELVTGAPLANGIANDSGEVYLYSPAGEGEFSEAPTLTLSGRRGGDQFGQSLARCDFNGDGFLDLAVGSIAAEDRDLGGSNHGAISLFLGADGGLLRAPDQVIYGKWMTEEGLLVPRDDLQFGYRLEAGDFNGDGICDLAASSIRYPLVNGERNRGAVAIFLGEAAEALSLGGLVETPATLIIGDQASRPSGRLGAQLLAVDFDSDGQSELLVAQDREHFGNEQDVGAVHLFSFDELGSATETARRSVESAIRSWRGLGAYDYFGQAIQVGDWDGDGAADLLVSDVQGRREEDNQRVGLVHIFLAEAGLPSLEAVETIHGDQIRGVFGESFALLEREGSLPQLAVFAGQDDGEGVNVGRPYLITDEVRRSLEIPGIPSGAFFGDALRALPSGRERTAGSIVGARLWASSAYPEPRQGAAFLYAHDEPNLDPPTPSQQLTQERLAEVEGFDQLGSGFAVLLNFDGSNRPLVAVGALADEQPRTYPGPLSVEPDPRCPARSSAAGVVYLFELVSALNGAPQLGALRFALFGSRPNENIRLLNSAGDVNGDGYEDLIAGAPNSDEGGNNTGRASFFFGGPADPAGGVIGRCADFIYDGVQANGQLGQSVVGLGDLDGDGCGEVAVGAWLQSPAGLTRQGAVHLLFGWGGSRCPAQPRRLLMTRAEREGRFGTSLASGDVDRDGLPDLAIGAFNDTVSGQRRGSVSVLLGAQLRRYPSRGIGQDIEPLSFDAVEARWRIEGQSLNERFGWQVALHEGLLFVAAPHRSVASTSQAGVVQVYRIDAMGIAAQPFAAMFGETDRPGAELGTALSVARVSSAQALFVAAGPRASGLFVGAGAAYQATVDF